MTSRERKKERESERERERRWSSNGNGLVRNYGDVAAIDRHAIWLICPYLWRGQRSGDDCDLCNRTGSARTFCDAVQNLSSIVLDSVRPECPIEAIDKFLLLFSLYGQKLFFTSSHHPSSAGNWKTARLLFICWNIYGHFRDSIWIKAGVRYVDGLFRRVSLNSIPESSFQTGRGGGTTPIWSHPLLAYPRSTCLVTRQRRGLHPWVLFPHPPINPLIVVGTSGSDRPGSDPSIKIWIQLPLLPVFYRGKTKSTKDPSESYPVRFGSAWFDI